MMSKLMIVEVPSYSCEFRGIREVAELIRCKECIQNSINCDGDENWCFRFGYDVYDDDFCSYGKRE